MSQINYYEILEINRNASDDEIRLAYKKLSKSVHPDSGGSAALFRLVNEAYVALSDPVMRAQHDRDISTSSNSDRFSEPQDPPYVRFEDVYKKWKENRNRIACPVEDSIQAGGVRKLVRSSTLLFFNIDSDTNSPFFPRIGKRLDFPSCGECGRSSNPLFLVSTNPFKFQTKTQNAGREIGHLDLAEPCPGCSQSRSQLFVIEFQVASFMNEAIQIETGDLVLFRAKFTSARDIVFGPVVEGFANNEFGLRNVKVKDEFSGEVMSPKRWEGVLGVWKSNNLSEMRSPTLRNWGP